MSENEERQEARMTNSHNLGRSEPFFFSKSRKFLAPSSTVKKPDDQSAAPTPLKSFALVDTRLIYCDDNLEQLKTLPDDSVDLIYVDPPFKSHLNCGVP